MELTEPVDDDREGSAARADGGELKRRGVEVTEAIADDQSAEESLSKRDSRKGYDDECLIQW